MVTADDKTVAQPSKTLIKIIADRLTKQIRGCVAIGNQASEVINLAALAIQSGISTRESKDCFSFTLVRLWHSSAAQPNFIKE